MGQNGIPVCYTAHVLLGQYWIPVCHTAKTQIVRYRHYNWHVNGNFH